MHSRGVVDHEIALNNSGVWVTNDSLEAFGRVNRSAGMLDAALQDPGNEGGGATLDIFQDGEAVVAWTRTQSRLFSVDTCDTVAGPGLPVDVAPASAVAMGGSVLAVITADKGEIRQTSYSDQGVPELSGLGADRPAAAALSVVSGLDHGVDVAVDSQGRVFAASASGQWALIDASGKVTRGSVGTTMSSVAVSLVGGVGVVVDSGSGDVYLSNGVHANLGAGAVPQQPGTGSTDQIVVASSSGLDKVSIFDGSVSRIYEGQASVAAAGAIARPVVLPQGIYGAWGGTPGQVAKVVSGEVQENIFPADRTALISPVFRVNRGSVVLNDTATGAIFDVDEQRLINNWEDVQPEPDESDSEANNSAEKSVRAEDDLLWVRPGRASVLHVLDNDQSPGTGIMAITGVTGPDASAVAISPDGQTLIVTTPARQVSDMQVTYTISNREMNTDEADVESHATVTISMRPDNENTAPNQVGTLGQDSTLADYTVASAGAVSVAPGPWWRDADSDPVSVVSASVGGRVVPVSPQGVIRYTAPAAEGQLTERIDYVTSDGRTTSTSQVYVRVMSSAAVEGVAPQAMSDAVRGVAGQALTIYPLDNDVPGCDPLNRQAALSLAVPLDTRVGLDVATDMTVATVTVTAERAGAYWLDYTVSFGSLFATGQIRVDIVADDGLVTVPDTAVVKGTVPAVVDVVGNDYDPAGSVLTVTSAVAREPDRVDAGVLQGRWLRVVMTSSVISSEPTIIDYTVVNGRGEKANGELSVTQVPQVITDHVSIVDDQARVRVGDVTAVQVLANDSSESGMPLVLNPDTAGMIPGQLRVDDPSIPPGEDMGDVGQAFVDGNQVRYMAPASGGPRRVRIEYQAGVALGSPQTGYVWVDVVPQPDYRPDDNPENTTGEEPAAAAQGNAAPQPASVDVRAVAGNRIQVPVTIYGQDPDGDSVMVVGLRTPPKSGRVVTWGPNWLIYESYPDVGNPGTDSFQFVVQDRFGAMGIGTVRVGLSAPGDVMAPIAVDDVVTARPDTAVRVFPVSNDIVALGTGLVDLVIEGDPSSVVVDNVEQSVSVISPAEDDPAVSVTYQLAAGSVSGSSAQILVRSQEGYVNPPNVYDHVAAATGTTASVDVLDDAWDTDGPTEAIHIVSVAAPGTFTGSVVFVPVSDQGQIIPFTVEDADGAQATAVVFVASSSQARPSLVQGGLITMDRNGTTTVNLNAYIDSPRGRTVYLVQATGAWTAPAANLDQTPNSSQSLTLTAKNDYTGPAALTVEVRDSSDATDPDALSGVVTIPVQIGPVTPVLWCPDTVQEIVQGGTSVSINVASLCHVWMPTQADANNLRFTGSWSLGGDGLTITGREAGGLPSDLLTLRADPDAQPGAESTLRIGVEGYDVTGSIRVRVIGAPKPKISVSSVTDVRQGTQVSVPVTVTSPMLNAQQNIVAVIQSSGTDAAVSFDDRSIQVTPAQNSHGTLTFDVVASDINDDARTDRQVTGVFSVTVYGTPSPPSPPQPGIQLRSRSAVVTFIPGADNGAPITGYDVQWDSGSASCGLNTTCEVPGLVNGTPYRFQARATNKAGTSDWSDWGPTVVPNAIPGVVTNFTASDPGCGTLTLSWGTPTGEGSAPTAYHLTWFGRTQPVTVNGSQTSYSPAGLDNNQPYAFTIVAQNQEGLSQQPVTVIGQSSCAPVWPSGAGVSISGNDMGDTAQIRVAWPPADAQGPDPVTYHVTRSGPDGLKTFAATQEVSLGDTGDELSYDGQVYTYTVTASNATGGPEHTSAAISGSWTAVGSPASWDSGAVGVDATGTDGQINVHVATFPNFRDSNGYVSVQVGTTELTRLTRADPSRTLGGYTNGQDVTVSFVACNTSGCNAATQATLQGGPFGPLPSPTIVAQQGEGRDVCFTASGMGNGRGATLVVEASIGRWEFPVADALYTSSLTCRDAGAWDTEISFAAHLESVSTTPGRSNSAQAQDGARSAVGVPDPWADGAVTAAPTGASGTIALTVTPFPVPNGGVLTVYYTVNGADPVPIGEPGTITVSGLSNAVRSTISVWASNGSSSNTPVAVTVTPYGPLDAPVLSPGAVDGKQVCVNAVGPTTGTNGAPARLRIVSDAPGVAPYESALANQVDPAAYCVNAPDYNFTVTFTASLVPQAGQNRTMVVSAPVSVTSAIGQPDALNPASVSVTATGNGGEVRIAATGPLPAANGGPGDVLSIHVTGLPGGDVYLTDSQLPSIQTGFIDGTPTLVTLIPCNSSGQCNTSGRAEVVVTTYGGMTLALESYRPVSASTANPDKTVCAEFTANTTGAPATFTVINDARPEDTFSTSVDGMLDHEVCTNPGVANLVVTFTATLEDLQRGRSAPPVSVSVTTPADAGAMSVKADGDPIVTSAPFTTRPMVQVCASFIFYPNGANAQGTIIRVNPGMNEEWDSAGVTGFAVLGTAASVRNQLCGTVPADGRRVEFSASITDDAGYGRQAQQDSSSVATSDPGQMSVVAAGGYSLEPRSGSKVYICQSFTFNPGEADATATIAPVDRSSGQWDADIDISLAAGSGAATKTLCGTVPASGETVEITAEITDDTSYGRQTSPVTVSVVTTKPGEMSVAQAGDMSFTPRGVKRVQVCQNFTFTPGGAAAAGTVTPVRHSDETWDQDVSVSLLASASPVTRQLCGTVPADGRAVEITARITDLSAYGREAPDEQVTQTVDNVPDLPLPTVSEMNPSPGSRSDDKSVCAAFTANGGGYPIRVSVVALGQSKVSDPGTEDVTTPTLCVNPGTASTPVRFNAEVTDVSGYERKATENSTYVTSPGDVPILPTPVLSTPWLPSGDPSSDKRVCTTVSANGGGYPVTVTVYGTINGTQARQSQSGSGLVQFDFCPNAGGPSVMVHFTATLTDDSEYARGSHDAAPVDKASSADLPVVYYPALSLRAVRSVSDSDYPRQIEYSLSGWPPAPVICLQTDIGGQVSPNRTAFTATDDGAWHDMSAMSGQATIDAGTWTTFQCSATYNGQPYNITQTLYT